MAKLAGALTLPATAAFAQQTPPESPAPAPPTAPASSTPPASSSPAPAAPATRGDDAEQEIVVRAAPDQRTSIDRDTYVVRDNAEARTSNALDVLGRIPSVTVQPDGAIRLLGTPGVTVLVDGRPVPNLTNFLRDLQGSQIARIEVVSNPSAQFSASGTGGIINIVTRNNFAGGLRGSLTASVSRYGGFELRASPSWTKGDWTISGSLARSRFGAEFESLRERESLDPADSALDTVEEQESRSRGDNLAATAQISHQLTEKQTLTLQGALFGGDNRNRGQTVIVTAAAPNAPLNQLTSGDFDYGGYNASLEYRDQGTRQGEMLTASIQQFRFDIDSETEVSTDFGGGIGLFRFDSGQVSRSRTFKFDYVRPLGGRQRLLFGGSLNDTRNVNELEQSGDLPLGGNPFPPASRIDGSRVEAAAYGSYQFGLLGGTVLAGVRIETRNYDFADEALGEGPSDSYAFPSLHLERPVASWLTANLSYSRRIAWPEIQDLSPALRFVDSTTAFTGNPLLLPELTDSYEARLRATLLQQNIVLTLFSRHTDNLYSNISSLTDDGVLLVRRVNFGERVDRGVSLAIQGPIGHGFSHSFNANLADRSIRQDGFDLSQVQPRATYGVTTQIDYRDGADGRRGTDRVTLTVRYSGPSDDGLTRVSSFSSVSASWSHAITDRLAAVLSADSLFGATTFRTVSFSEEVVSRETRRFAGPRVRLALTYSLGTPGRQDPSTPPPPPIPVPGGQ